MVEGVPDPIPGPPEDGLHRFIVRSPTPTDASPTEGPTESPGGDATIGSDEGAARPPVAPPRDPAWTLDQSLVDRIDEDTVVVFEDGIPGFRDADGAFVPLVGNSTASSGTPVPRTGDPVTERDFIDELLDIDGVVSAIPIGDGSYAVVAEEADSLDGHGLDPVVDTPFALAADPYEYYQWTLDNDGSNLSNLSNPPNQSIDADIDGVEAKAGARGAGVVVAVIDTGVDFSHPDLAGQSWVNDDEICSNLIDDDQNGYVDDCNGWDFGNEDNQSYGPGQQEHGTHVAGTIAAIADNGVGVVGMAPQARIMDLNVEGPGGMTMSGISRAVRYAADNGADVINMSLGTQPGTPAAAVGGLIDAVRHAEAKGSLVVVAAGNSSVNLDSAPVYPANIEGPNMITVGASAPDETKASFSNHGSPVDLFAPGVLIVSTVPGGGYKFMNGTSMASPTVAGAAAAVLSAYPDLDPLGAREQLVGTADQVASYDGLATNPVRINQAWAVGLDGDPDVAQVSVSGLTAATSEGVEATISMSDPGGRYAEQPYHWEASLVAIEGNQVYGIVDHALTVDWRAETTNDRGAVPIADAGDEQARLTTELPPGTYGLIVEAIPDDDAGVRLGDAFVSTFVVPVDPLPEPDPDPGDGGSTSTTTASQPPTTTSPTDPTSTTQPAPTTTAQGSTTTGPTATRPPTTTGPTTTRATMTPWPTTTWAWPTTAPPSGGNGGPTTTSAPTTTAAPPTTRPATTSPTTTVAPPTTSASTTRRPATTSPTTSPTASGPTTAPPTTSGPTTSPPTTSTPAPTTTPTTGAPPTTTVSGGFAVHAISPDAGYIDQQTMVSIDGTFPSFVNVWFGDQSGDIIHHSSNWIVVVAPARRQAGPVDVTLRSNSAGAVLLVRDGFTYVDPQGGSGPTTTMGPTTSTTAGNGGGGAPSTTTTTSSGGGNDATTTTRPGITPTTSPSTTAPSTTGSTTSSTAAPTTSTSGPATTTTTEPPGVERQPRASASGGAIDLGGGLQGVPLSGLGGLGGVPVCMSDPCRATRL